MFSILSYIKILFYLQISYKIMGYVVAQGFSHLAVYLLFVSSLWQYDKERRWVSPKVGFGVFQLSLSLRLRYMRNTAWNWKKKKNAIFNTPIIKIYQVITKLGSVKMLTSLSFPSHWTVRDPSLGN